LSEITTDSVSKLPPKMSFKNLKTLPPSTQDIILSSDLYKQCVKERDTYLKKLSYICEKIGGSDFAHLTPSDWLLFDEVPHLTLFLFSLLFLFISLSLSLLSKQFQQSTYLVCEKERKKKIFLYKQLILITLYFFC
jgi:hypothetical protein